MLNKVSDLVHTQWHCVLATCGGDPCAPHASLMSYCAAPDCSEFWLATPRTTRKWMNLAGNSLASLLIDDRAGKAGQGAGVGQALTVAARLEPFASAAAEAAARRALQERHPGLADFLAQEDVVVLRLRAASFQLLTGLSDVFFIEAEKMLDARPRKA